MPEFKFFKNPAFWLFLTLTLIWLAFLSLPDNNLHLVFCQVGQGDANLITYRQTQILVDGGPDNSVLNCLADNMPFWDRKIEMVLLTHPEADHFTGLIEVVERYQVDYLLLNPDLQVSTDGFRELKTLIDNYQIKNYAPKKGDKIEIDPVLMSFIWPPRNLVEFKNLNDSSLVFKLVFGQFEVLFLGDISSEIEDELEVDEVAVLKVAHHGSKFSTNESFLSKISPKIAVICVGKNRFGHPHPDVLNRLLKQNVKTLRTDQSEVEIISNGIDYQIASQ